MNDVVDDNEEIEVEADQEMAEDIDRALLDLIPSRKSISLFLFQDKSRLQHAPRFPPFRKLNSSPSPQASCPISLCPRTRFDPDFQADRPRSPRESWARL